MMGMMVVVKMMTTMIMSVFSAVRDSAWTGKLSGSWLSVARSGAEAGMGIALHKEFTLASALPLCPSHPSEVGKGRAMGGVPGMVAMWPEREHCEGDCST